MYEETPLGRNPIDEKGKPAAGEELEQKAMHLENL
jgi:hypothetical protein